MPISHIGLPVADLKASTAFYVSALAPLGYIIFKEIDNVVVGYGPKRGAPDFWIANRSEEKGSITKLHMAFTGTTKKQVHDFYDAALKAGATCNGPPGERPESMKGYYAAYVLDPDGHNIECMFWAPWWLTAIKQAPKVLGVAAVGLAWWAGRNGWMMG